MPTSPPARAAVHRPHHRRLRAGCGAISGRTGGALVSEERLSSPLRHAEALLQQIVRSRKIHAKHGGCCACARLWLKPAAACERDAAVTRSRACVWKTQRAARAGSSVQRPERRCTSGRSRCARGPNPDGLLLPALCLAAGEAICPPASCAGRGRDPFEPGRHRSGRGEATNRRRDRSSGRRQRHGVVTEGLQPVTGGSTASRICSRRAPRDPGVDTTCGSPAAGRPLGRSGALRPLAHAPVGAAAAAPAAAAKSGTHQARFFIDRPRFAW